MNSTIAALVADDGSYHANPRCAHIVGRRNENGNTGLRVTSERLAEMTRLACHACWRLYGYVLPPEKATADGAGRDVV